MKKKILALTVLTLSAQNAFATCDDVDHTTLVTQAATVMDEDNGGLGFPMWVTIVDETGKVCHVVNTNGEGDNSNDAWLGSRVISAQKANTANAFSHDGFSLSTANLYSAVQPGGSLYGLQHSNPVDASVAYLGDTTLYGTTTDPLVGQRIGGVNVFGGGLALYKAGGVKVGAIGVSGDTSCTDHVVAWKIRAALELDKLASAASLGGATNKDGMIQDITGSKGNFSSKGGFGHPSCLNNPTDANDDGSITGNKKK
jgi:uncharacterized protein GlcG (DUF336 family)